MRALGRSLKRILCRMTPITSSSTVAASPAWPSLFFFFLSTSSGFFRDTLVPASSWYPMVKVYAPWQWRNHDENNLESLNEMRGGITVGSCLGRRGGGGGAEAADVEALDAAGEAGLRLQHALHLNHGPLRARRLAALATNLDLHRAALASGLVDGLDG